MHSTIIAPVFPLSLFVRQIVAPELFVSAFVLGALFARRSAWFCAPAGLLSGYLVSLLFLSGDHLFFWTPRFVSTCVLLALAVPLASDIAGRVLGSWAKANLF